MEHFWHLVESMPQQKKKDVAVLRVEEHHAQKYQGVSHKIVNECIYNTGKGHSG